LETRWLEEFFSNSVVMPITPVVLDEAIRLRRQRRMGLGDSLIAGTARIHGCTLVTRNTDDFDWIPGLNILNSFAGRP
jgi:predicted nucleic acid-binding protein